MGIQKALIAKRRKMNREKRNGEKDFDHLYINSASVLLFQAELVC